MQGVFLSSKTYSNKKILFYSRSMHYIQIEIHKTTFTRKDKMKKGIVCIILLTQVVQLKTEFFLTENGTVLTMQTNDSGINTISLIPPSVTTLNMITGNGGSNTVTCPIPMSVETITLSCRNGGTNTLGSQIPASVKTILLSISNKGTNIIKSKIPSTVETITLEKCNGGNNIVGVVPPSVQLNTIRACPKRL